MQTGRGRAGGCCVGRNIEGGSLDGGFPPHLRPPIRLGFAVTRVVFDGPFPRGPFHFSLHSFMASFSSTGAGPMLLVPCYGHQAAALSSSSSTPSARALGTPCDSRASTAPWGLSCVGFAAAHSLCIPGCSLLYRSFNHHLGGMIVMPHATLFVLL
jgi:hypothetical protein